MENEKYILVRLFCEQTQIDPGFIQNLQEYELVEFEKRDNDLFMDENDISEIERMFRLHHDLGINYEGLDAINQMLVRIQQLQKEMDMLKRRLRIYE